MRPRIGKTNLSLKEMYDFRHSEVARRRWCRGAARGPHALATKLGIAPVGVDSALGMILVAVAVKLVSWLVSKVPAGD